MKPPATSFSDRQTAAAEARMAMLAKFKPKPTVTDPNFVPREARKAAEREKLREEREAAKELARQAAAAAEEARRLALLNDEEAQLALKRDERKQRKAEAKAAARAKRESRRAAG